MGDLESLTPETLGELDFYVDHDGPVCRCCGAAPEQFQEHRADCPVPHVERHADAWAAHLASRALIEGDRRDLLRRLEAAERHYKEHEGCSEDCTCENFVREWEEAAQDDDSSGHDCIAGTGWAKQE